MNAQMLKYPIFYIQFAKWFEIPLPTARDRVDKNFCVEARVKRFCFELISTSTVDVALITGGIRQLTETEGISFRILDP